jgi:hypothetical protein
MFLADPFLNSNEFIIPKFEDLTTADASEMGVMPVAVDVFVMEVSVLEINLSDQTAFNEEGDGPVYGCPRYGTLLLP